MFRSYKRKAFSLLEILAAIFVLMVGLLSITNVVFSSILQHRLNRDQLVASYLAQEGIELIRNMRDTNWLNNRPFDAGIPAGSWEIDYTSDSFSSFKKRNLKLDSLGFYQYGVGSPTPFVRKIEIRKPSPVSLEVKVTVTWERLSRTFSVEATETLYDWYRP